MEQGDQRPQARALVQLGSLYDVSEKVVEWVVDEPVPVTVMVEVAIGVDDDVVMVMVEL